MVCDVQVNVEEAFKNKKEYIYYARYVMYKPFKLVILKYAARVR